MIEIISSVLFITGLIIGMIIEIYELRNQTDENKKRMMHRYFP